MHVERDVDEVLRDGVADDIALLIGGILQQLLAEIVAERIYSRVQYLRCEAGDYGIPVMRSAK
jgi:hypothetical protein